MRPLFPRLSRAAVLAGVALAGCATQRGQTRVPYDFSKPPYVHPRIVEDLTTWLSDSGDQVVAINLLDAQDSNRYSGDVLTRETGRASPFVHVRNGKEIFGYEYVGTTRAGVSVLRTSYSGGGTGVFECLLLVRFDTDVGFGCDWRDRVVRPGRERILIRKLGEIPLGDRWSGRLQVRGDEIVVGRDCARGSGDLWGGVDHVLKVTAVGNPRNRGRPR